MTLGKDGVTTGASNDIERATKLAHNMVTQWGLSESLGPLHYEQGSDEYGRPSKELSDETAKQIDAEVRSIIDECYQTAERILEENRDKLEVMAMALMKYETIDADQISDIMAGIEPREPADWNNDPPDGDGGVSAKKEETTEKVEESDLGDNERNKPGSDPLTP